MACYLNRADLIVDTSVIVTDDRFGCVKEGKKALCTENILSKMELTHKLRVELSAYGEGYMTKFFFILTALLAITAGPAFAQSQDDQAACTPDVMRLCQQEIPDQGRIVACLVRSKLQLSPACSGVFN